MLSYHNLRGRHRRRHNRLLRRVIAVEQEGTGRVVYVRHEPEFRAVERLHRAGLVSACVSKWNFLGVGKRVFRELAVFATEGAALKHYDRLLTRKGK